MILLIYIINKNTIFKALRPEILFFSVSPIHPSEDIKGQPPPNGTSFA